MKKIASLVCTSLLIHVLFSVAPGTGTYGHGDAKPPAGSVIGLNGIRQTTMLAAVMTSGLPEALVSAFGERTGRESVKETRIASVLQKVGKTLILERTRGVKEVELYRKAAPAVVLVLTNESVGSGAIIDAEGHVITNWHVVEGQPQVVVVFKPKDSTELKKELAFRATVEKVDQVTDLALLKVHAPPKTLAFLRLGDILTLAVGQDVHAIGHPEGEVWTYTKGIISQIRANYSWSTSEDRAHRAKVVQTQTPVNPGNSGGPLLDDGGMLIGINSFRRQGEGLNYAVAVDVIQEFLQRRESREISPRQPTGVAKGEPRCTEGYQTTRQGWTDIVGCYLTASAPPPDLWLIYRNPNSPAAYGARDLLIKGQINTVITSKNQEWESLEYYMDLDCNGTVDLIGRQYRGSAQIDSYQLPAKPLRLDTMAKELDRAFKGRKIPYPRVRVCQ